MKLKSTFFSQTIDGTQFLVALGGEGFSGLVRSNETAAFIVDQLARETSRDAIVDAMCGEYDAPREQISADVDEILDTLRGIGALDE